MAGKIDSTFPAGIPTIPGDERKSHDVCRSAARVLGRVDLAGAGARRRLGVRDRRRSARAEAIAPAIAGMLLGYLAITLVVAAGVGALVTRHPELLTLMSPAGAAYLLWLGAQVIRHPAVPEAGRGGGSSAGLGAARLSGQRHELKALLLMLALLPQFTRAQAPWAVELRSARWAWCRCSTARWSIRWWRWPAAWCCAPDRRPHRRVSRPSGVAMIAVAALLLAEQAGAARLFVGPQQQAGPVVEMPSSSRTVLSTWSKACRLSVRSSAIRSQRPLVVCSATTLGGRSARGEPRRRGCPPPRCSSPRGIAWRSTSAAQSHGVADDRALALQPRDAVLHRRAGHASARASAATGVRASRRSSAISFRSVSSRLGVLMLRNRVSETLDFAIASIGLWVSFWPQAPEECPSSRNLSGRESP